MVGSKSFLLSWLKLTCHLSDSVLVSGKSPLRVLVIPAEPGALHRDLAVLSISAERRQRLLGVRRPHLLLAGLQSSGCRLLRVSVMFKCSLGRPMAVFMRKNFLLS